MRSYTLLPNVTASIASEISSALWSMGDPIRTKQALKIGIEATNKNGVVSLSATVDNENRESPPYTLSSTIEWQNNSLQTVGWSNSSGVVIGWGTTGYSLYKTDAQQWGKYLGITINSNSPNFVINGLEVEHELRVRF